MTANQRLNLAGRVAMWGGESGIIVTMAGVVPALFLGTKLQEDIAAVAMLAAYGLLFGHYLARRLVREGVAGAEHTRLLRIAPPVAMATGYIGMRLVMDVSGADSLTAVHGVLFGGLAGLILGLALLRLPLAPLESAPLPRIVLVPGALLAAGAVMGIAAGFALSIPLGWIVAIPIWQVGIGAAMGLFLAPPAASG